MIAIERKEERPILLLRVLLTVQKETGTGMMMVRPTDKRQEKGNHGRGGKRKKKKGLPLASRKRLRDAMLAHI